jgi:hypothetical protein
MAVAAAFVILFAAPDTAAPATIASAAALAALGASFALPPRWNRWPVHLALLALGLALAPAGADVAWLALAGALALAAPWAAAEGPLAAPGGAIALALAVAAITALELRWGAGAPDASRLLIPFLVGAAALCAAAGVALVRVRTEESP